MSDARWFEIDSAVAAAIRHFGGAVSIYGRLPVEQNADDRYLVEMAFMHAMQAGHTSLEAALLRILELCEEAAPTGSSWHADLIRRAANAVGERPVIARLAAIGPLAISRQVLREYLAVTTRPQVWAKPLTLAEAIADTASFNRNFTVLEDGLHVWDRLATLSRGFAFGGRQVHDANIVATMLAHGGETPC